MTRPAPVLAVLALVLLAATAAAAEEAYTQRVAVVLYDGVEVLDFAGPSEVFAAAGGFGSRGDEPAFEVYTVGRTRDAITSQGFLEVLPDYSIADAPLPDVLVLPGGGTGAVRADAEFMAWIDRAAAGADVSLTVCTGAFILGQTGRLDGREATTWYNAVDRLAAAFPAAKVQPGRRFVDSGNVVTTAGVSAGIDGSLHVVARLLGRRVADRTAQYMEYHWSPEAYLADAYPADNPRLDERGRAVAAADELRARGDLRSAEAAYRALAEADPQDGRSWYQLGYSIHAQGGRWAEAAEVHRRASTFPAYRAAGLYNLACALALQGRSEAALDTLEALLDSGFTNTPAIATDTDFDSLRDEPRFQALLAAD
jgi:putative intracellular protease/amidase